MDHALRRWLAQVSRTVQWHRRLLAAGLAAAAVALALHAAEPSPPATVPMVVAARDLPGGTRLSAGDLEVANALGATVPDGVLRDTAGAEGRLLAGPVRAGEPVTDVRLLGPSLLDGWGEGLVASPVRIADPGVLELVRPGDRLDLIAVPADGTAAAAVVASQVPLLTIPPRGESGALAEGALLIVAVTPEQGTALAEAAVTSRLSVVLRR